MDIMELGAIGELVGGVAVIGSLLFVGLQVRTSNRVASAESIRSFVSDYNATMHKLLEPGMNAVLRKGIADFDALDNDEKSRVHVWAITHMMLAQASFILGKRGLSDPDLVGLAAQFNAVTINEPGFATWWEMMKPGLNPDFVSFLDRERRQTPRLTEILPFFQPNPGSPS